MMSNNVGFPEISGEIWSKKDSPLWSRIRLDDI